MYDAAQHYISLRLKIFPTWWTVDGVCACDRGPTCHSPGKHPRVRHGVLNAGSDPRAVHAWWTRWPDANIGLPAHANGLAVIDVDPKNGGDQSLTDLYQHCLVTHGIDLMATRTIRTGGNPAGLHLYYRAPVAGITSTAHAFGPQYPGLDTRGRGGYTIAPPSVHASGGRYQRADSGHPIAPWPAALAQLVTPAPQPQPTRGGADPGRPVPADDRLSRRLQIWATRGYLDQLRHLRSLPADRGGYGKNDALKSAAWSAGLRLDAHLLLADLADKPVLAELGPVARAGDVERQLLNIASRWTGHAERDSMVTIASGLDKTRGQAHTLRLPPWATNWTPGGNA